MRKSGSERGSTAVIGSTANRGHMSKLPRVSGRECIRALEKVGFYLKRQEGSTSSCVEMILSRRFPFPSTKSSTVAR